MPKTPQREKLITMIDSPQKRFLLQNKKKTGKSIAEQTREALADYKAKHKRPK